MAHPKEISLTDLFKIEDLQRLQDLFADANEVASIITLPDGTPVTTPSNFTQLCQDLIRKTEKGCANCMKSDSTLGKYNPIGPTIQRCLSGKLWDAGVSIRVKDKHIANWLIGQVRTSEEIELQMVDYAKEIGIDRTEFIKAFEKIPIMSVDKFRNIAKMLYAFVNELSENAYLNFQLKIEISKREKATKKLAKRERIYHAVLEASPDDITITDLNGYIKMVSPAALKMFGYGQFIAKNKVHISNFIHHSDRERLANDLISLIEGNVITLVEYKGVKKDGQVFSVEINSQLIANQKSKSNEMIFIVRDISERKKVEEQLKESEGQFRAISEYSFNSICIIDKNGKIQWVNDAMIQMSGYSKEQVYQSASFLEFLAPESVDFVMSNFLKFVNGEEYNHHYFLNIIEKNGNIIYCEKYMSDFTDHNGNTNLIISMMDITEQKRAELLLIESEAKHRVLFMDSPDSYFIFRDGVIIDCNRASEMMLGGKKEQIIGLKPSDLSPEYQPDGTKSLYKSEQMIALATNKGIHTFEWVHRKFDGSDLIVEISLATIILDQKPALFATWRDISERKKQELALRESEKKFKSIYDGANDAIFILKENVFVDCNHRAKVLFKADKEQIIGKKVSDFSPTRQNNSKYSETESQEKIQSTLTNSFQFFDWKHQCLDHTIIDTEVCLSKIEINSSSHILAVVRDVSERKKLIDSIKESERSKSVLLANLPGMVYRCKYDPEWTMLFVSDQCYTLTGYRKEDLIKNKTVSFNNLILPKYQKHLWDTWSFAVKNHTTVQVEYEIETATHEFKWVWEQGLPIYDRDGNIEALEGFIIDITERKILEEKLKEDEAQYRNLADSGEALIWKSGLDKMCYYFNEPWLKFTGRTFEQEKGNGWTEGVHSEDFNRCLGTYVNAFDKQESFTMEYRLRNANGEYRWVLDIGTPNYNYNQQFIGYIGHCFDITERKNIEKEMELKNQELSILNAEKDKFFSIIAHDLRSPFNGFMGLTQILSDDLPNLTQEEISQYAESMKSSAINLYQLLENLLEWARSKRGLIPYNPKPNNTKTLINNAILPLIDSAIEKDITIINKATDFTLIADEYMISSVIRNIVSNSLKYTNKGGLIEILSSINKGNIEITISDNGIGMCPKLVNNLFNIGAQTNRKGTNGEASSGLGLILCKDFINQHNGLIWAESEEKIGTKFHISIPNMHDK